MESIQVYGNWFWISIFIIGWKSNGRKVHAPLWHFPLQFYLTTMVQAQKLLTSLKNNVEGPWLGNIYEHFSRLEIP